MALVSLMTTAGWIGCGEPEPIVTGAPAETEQRYPESASNIVDPSQPVTGVNRGDVIEGRHIPPADPRFSADETNAPPSKTQP